jgi:hypothetical protein
MRNQELTRGKIRQVCGSPINCRESETGRGANLCRSRLKLAGTWLKTRLNVTLLNDFRLPRVLIDTLKQKT